MKLQKSINLQYQRLLSKTHSVFISIP